MKLSKGKLTVVAFIILVAIGVIAYVSLNEDNEEDAKEPLTLIEVPEDGTVINDGDDAEDKVELHETEPVEEAGTNSKNFVYDPFAEDAGWGDQSIFGDKIIINGTGQRAEIKESKYDSYTEETIAKKNTRQLSAAEAKASIMEEVKSNDYAYRINEKDFSDGFGIYMNPKYELSVSRIMGDTGYISAPNGTEVAITELDSRLSLNEHRKKLLIDSGYRAVYNYSSNPIFSYGTPVTLGVGIDNFESTPMYTAWRYNDESVNDYGGQLFCDTEVKSAFGEGYYIELYNATSGLYYGYYLVEHNGRMFKATGMSTYRDTLIDITMATIDTCVYPY